MYASYFASPEGMVTGCTEEIERLRPKSPTPKNKSGGVGGDREGRGRGRSRGGGPRGGSRGGHMPGAMAPIRYGQGRGFGKR